MRREARLVLVTGGAGFIGSHTCKALALAGWTPVTYDNLSTGHRDAVRWGPFVQGDVRDRNALDKLFGQHRFDAVLHFAASAYVGESMAVPDAYYDNNVIGMLSLLGASAAAGIRGFVFSSSCATYGIPDRLPITEDTEQRPINPYGRTKLIGEQMLRDIGTQHGIGHVMLRYFNAAGADPEGELSERHDPETHLIPLALAAAHGGAPLKIFGTDYETPDGTCVRDFVHVTDLARGHVAALEHLDAARRQGRAPSDAVNLGTGRGTSVREICAAIESHTGRAVAADLAPRRPGDPAVLVADPSRAQELLGFRCIHSDLEAIVETAAARYRAADQDALPV